MSEKSLPVRAAKIFNALTIVGSLCAAVAIGHNVLLTPTFNSIQEVETSDYKLWVGDMKFPPIPVQQMERYCEADELFHAIYPALNERDMSESDVLFADMYEREGKLMVYKNPSQLVGDFPKTVSIDLQKVTECTNKATRIQQDFFALMTGFSAVAGSLMAIGVLAVARRYSKSPAP